jgi:nucleolar GTP-binding protein
MWNAVNQNITYRNQIENYSLVFFSQACEKLLAMRVELKLKGHKIGDVLNRLHLAEPQARDDTPRPPHIPEAITNRMATDTRSNKRRRLERDVETENGGPGVYSVDLKSS